MKGLKFKSCHLGLSAQVATRMNLDTNREGKYICWCWVARFWSSTNVQLNKKPFSFLGGSSSLVLVGCICSFSQSVLSLLHGVSNRLETHTALKLLHWSHLWYWDRLSLLDLKQEWRDMTRQTRQNKTRTEQKQYKENCFYISITDEVEKDKGEGKEKKQRLLQWQKTWTPTEIETELIL